MIGGVNDTLELQAGQGIVVVGNLTIINGNISLTVDGPTTSRKFSYFLHFSSTFIYFYKIYLAYIYVNGCVLIQNATANIYQTWLEDLLIKLVYSNANCSTGRFQTINPTVGDECKQSSAGKILFLIFLYLL